MLKEIKIDVKATNFATYVVIDNLYEPEELALMKKEVEFLWEHDDLNGIESSARYENQVSKKTAKGIWLHNFYKGPFDSKIGLLTKKLFHSDLLDILEKENVMFKLFRHCARFNSMLNFYADGKEYDSHVDTSLYTAVTFFNVHEYQGGRLHFPELNEFVEPIDGRVVLFPGQLEHRAEKVKCDDGKYRATLASFITINNNQ